jgi:anti-sigma regulatory factor (Ser/Thr protein kinase)
MSGTVTADRLGEHPDEADQGRPYLRASYAAVRSSVPTVRRALAELAASAGAPDWQLDGIRLAASEALTNIVLHAYPARSGQIHVTAGVAGNEFWVLIADDGRGIKAGPESDGLGLGLALIAQLTDDFAIVERSSGGTELQLRFVLAPGRSPGDDQPRGSLRSASLPASPRFRTTT